jgi:hypothetical protein
VFDCIRLLPSGGVYLGNLQPTGRKFGQSEYSPIVGEPRNATVQSEILFEFVPTNDGRYRKLPSLPRHKFGAKDFSFLGVIEEFPFSAEAHNLKVIGSNPIPATKYVNKYNKLKWSLPPDTVAVTFRRDPSALYSILLKRTTNYQIVLCVITWNYFK